MSLSYSYPGVYIEEKDTGARPIQGVSTTTAAFLGAAPDPGATKQAQAVNNFTQFKETFCGASKDDNALANAVFGFFVNGGSRCFVVNVPAGEALHDGLAQIAANDEIAMVAAPGRFDLASTTAVLDHCEDLRDRFAILDASGPARVKIEALAVVGTAAAADAKDDAPAGLRARASGSGYGAQYFPWLKAPNALNPSQEVYAPPSGHVAGVYARTDTQRGVFKAPANEILRGVLGVAQNLTNAEQGKINRSGVNCIRSFSAQGIVVWGARTLAPDGSNWTYVSVRRLLLFIEQSIYRSTGWVVFEPNDRPLWKSIRRDVSAFLTMLWRSGALAGATAEQAFFVKCDEETNPQARIDVGIVTIVIGVAPVKPAEFVVFEIGQTSGQAEA